MGKEYEVDGKFDPERFAAFVRDCTAAYYTDEGYTRLPWALNIVDGGGGQPTNTP